MFLVSPPYPVLAQREPTVADLEDGERLFSASCTTCHGAEGDAIFGVDLTHGQFRGATTDEDLLRVIREGLPGTAMPAGNFSEAQANAIVSYLRSLVSTPASLVPGNADRGKTIFEGNGACTGCHRVNGSGSRVGPDLSDIGELRRAVEIERSLLDPDAEIAPANRSVRVVTRDGVAITGRLLNHDSLAVLLIDPQERLRSFAKTNLSEFGFVDRSPMPSYRGKLAADELTDVVRYLVSLKGVKANNP
jgi:putative heme-binding domain-containing protein